MFRYPFFSKSLLLNLFDKVTKKILNPLIVKEETNSLLLAKILIENQKKNQNNNHLSYSEFKVFSQFGEDGIIQYLINNIPIKNKIFIEFGVENYTESNTRFLLMNNNWSGLVMDGSQENINFIKNDRSIYWKYDIKAICSFITRENINKIFSENNIEGDIGLLSIDIDGNDYWVWKAINIINPRIVICEYNSLFGMNKSITIPYNAAFNRTNSHYSNLYWGASLKALYNLAQDKGYDFVGCNSAGNNAFFVRKDLSSPFRVLTVSEGYVLSKFRESRDEKGNLTYLSGRKRIEMIENLEVYDLDNDRLCMLRELL